MRDRHWGSLTESLGFTVRPDDKFTLRKGLEELKLQTYLPNPTLPYPTLPYPTLPYSTLLYPTPPFPTLPCPTLNP